jgi:eukaryotic-like serine/threonine-protein kinase
MNGANHTPDRGARLGEAIAAFYGGRDRGLPVNRQELLDAYPDVAADLRSFFTTLGDFERLAGEATPRPAQRAGQAPRQLGGYTLLEEVGRGGMGVVYKAWQADLGRWVAIKMLLAGPCASDEEVTRLRNEAALAAGLGHPAIVPIHEVGARDGQHYFVMDWVDGGNLAERVRVSALPPAEAAGCLEVIAEAVHFAHRRGVLHRDLKPANILLDRDGKPHVTDFGLAKRTEGEGGLTQPGAAVGTASYMAPEQAAGAARLTPAADVYALGAVLYELLTGRPPFKAATTAETLWLVRTEEPVPPRRLQPKCPRDLETVCLKCLRKEPTKRYPSAQELADDLRRFLDDKPVRARPVGSLGRGRRWCRRNPALAAALAALAAVLVAGLVAVLWQWRRAERESASARHERNVAQAEGRRADVNARRAHAAVGRMLTHMGKERLAGVPRLEGVRRDLLEEALRFNLEFLRESAGDPAVRHEAAMAYAQVGQVRAQLGQAREAEEAGRQAAALLGALAHEYPREAEYRKELAAVYDGLAVLLARQGRHEEAREAHQEVERLVDGLGRGALTGPEARFVVALLHGNQSYRLHLAGQHEAALAHARQAVELETELAAAGPDNWTYRRALAVGRNTLGTSLSRAGRLDEARDVYRQALGSYRALLARSPADVGLRAEMGTVWRNLGLAHRRQKALADARAAYREAEAVFARLAEDFPAVPRYHSELAETLTGLFLVLDDSDAEEGRRAVERAAHHGRTAHALDRRSPAYRRQLCGYLFAWASFLAERGDHRGAFAAAAEMAGCASEEKDFRLAADLLTRCARMAEGDPKLTAAQRRERAEVYAARAVAVLGEGLRTGALSAAQVKGGDFAALRGRADYQKLLTAPRPGP